MILCYSLNVVSMEVSVLVKEFIDDACEGYEFVVREKYEVVILQSMVILCFHLLGIALWA